MLSTVPARLQKRQGNVVNGTSPLAKKKRKLKQKKMFQRNENMIKYKKGKEIQRNLKDISQVSLTKIHVFCKKNKEMLYNAGFSKTAEPS